MKTTKKKILLCLFIFEIFLVLVPLLIDVQGFKNGQVTGTTFNPYYASESEILDWYRHKFGTHDWLAEAALDAILSDQIANAKWRDGDTIFWTEKRKVCFYIGTEAPDTHDGSDDSTAVTYLVLNGIACHGMVVKTNMFFYDNDGSTLRMRPRSYNKFVTDCYTWTVKAKNYLREGKCDAAAFYMGAITHLIADMACWPHLLYWRDVTPPGESSILGGLHEDFEKQVQKVTKYSSKYHPEKREMQFSYPENFPIGTVMACEPVLALELVAFDTRWDYDISWVDIYTTPYPSYVASGSYPATYQYDSYDEYNYGKEVKDWTSQFKDRVQENLDKAVKYIAYAINYIADAWAEGDDPKSCEECSGSNNPNQELSKGSKMARMLSVILILGIVNLFFVPYLQILERTILT